MVAILKYKPIIVLMLVLFMVFSLLGVDYLHADEDHEVHEDEDSSILGSFFNFVGNVIAFPFRIVGKAFDSIF